MPEYLSEETTHVHKTYGAGTMLSHSETIERKYFVTDESPLIQSYVDAHLDDTEIDGFRVQHFAISRINAFGATTCYVTLKREHHPGQTVGSTV